MEISEGQSCNWKRFYALWKRFHELERERVFRGKVQGRGWRRTYMNRIRATNIDVFTMILKKIREILRCTNPKHTALPCA
jgi:hypothetical protein